MKGKIIQTAIAFQLENHYTKKQIFTIYANEIPLGQRGSFAIDGFGEAAQAYFGKNIRDLTSAGVRAAGWDDPGTQPPVALSLSATRHCTPKHCARRDGGNALDYAPAGERGQSSALEPDSVQRG